MYRALLKLHIYIKNRVLDLSYAYGFFVADHSLYVILICFGVFLLSLFQITTNVPPPGSTLEIFAESSRSFRPVRARLELNTSDQLHDKQPDKPLWYSGYPLAYVQHIVIRCSTLTSRPSCLLRARDIRDRLFSDPQFDANCLRVGEPINAQQMTSYLPSFGCLFLSPLNLWSNDLSNIISNEREILESIPTLSKRYADIIFGIPQEYFSSHKPLTYAITLLLNNASNEYRQDLKKRLFALDEQQKDDIIHIYFSRKSLLYYLPLVLIYIVVFLYIYYSVSQFECVKSKWGLALAATVQIVVSLLISLALSSLFHMTPRLDGGEVFPYLVIFIGLENLVVLTRAVTSSQAQKQYDDIRERVAHALRAESWTISKHLVYELVIVMIGFITYVPTVREFCQLALIGILIDFFMQINFWLAVLSIDIRRFTVGVGKKKNRNLEQEKKEIKVSLPMRMPYLTSRRQQQQQQSQWARYRVLQRGSMFLVLVWVILIFYKSCLIVDLLHKNVQINREQIKDFVPEKMLNEHYGSSISNQYDSNINVEDQMMNNVSLPNYEWQTLLSYDHWSTLFSFYNISYDNRYLSIMPSIYLPVVSSEDQPFDVKAKTPYYNAQHRPLIDATITSTSSSLIDRRFSTALWELLFIVLFGLTLFSIVYFCFFSSSFTLNSSHNRSLSYIKSDHSIVPTILIPPSSTLLIESVYVHESGTVVSVAYSNGSICMWNPQTGGIILTQQRYSIASSEKIISHVWCSLMIDELRCLFGCSNGQIEIYPNNSTAKNLILSGCDDLGGITHLIRASPTLIISVTRRGYVILFEYSNGLIKQIYIKRIHQWPIRVCQMDFNSSIIFTGSDDHSIKVTSVSNGSCLHTLQKHRSPINCLALDPYHPTILVSGCFNGVLCVWKGDDLIQTNLHAHPSSIITDLNFCGHSSNIISLGTDKRLCIWTQSNLQLLYELNDITSNCFTIHRTNYLFYTKLNSLFVYDTFNQTKISTRQFLIPFLNDINRDENEMNIDKIIYSSQTETLILQNSDIVYAMHLPQSFFLVR
ncbi:unnamed protein product [Rotaria magnacalcarata]|uniref:Sterol regulatory element-binding protein cleavage-activating protein n=1 Tax=Rotaria magnacalcarata TaxID=392030 RepID=A0A816TAT9_9BILA|nr:unnamed protein product [Rotaria magnacalcarata]CAF1629087.1 unnamed protein product [Rotaria magnacalcarata]CAF2098645.1 unnamed protein product [Rotaria magnacalcarata]